MMNKALFATGFLQCSRGNYQVAQPVSISLAEIEHGYVWSEAGWATI